MTLSFCAEGSLEADLWVLDRTLQILFGEVGQVVKGIRQSITKRRITGPKRKMLNAVANYLYRNRTRMRYHEIPCQGMADRQWPGRRRLQESDLHSNLESTLAVSQGEAR